MRQTPARRPAAFTLVEAIVAMAILSVAISVTTAAMFRVRQTWRSIDRQSAVAAELSAIMETVVTDPRRWTESSIAEIQLSDDFRSRWPDATLRCELMDDSLGRRVVMTSSPGTGRSAPVQLVGWLGGKR